MKWRIGKRGGLARPTPESEGDHLLLLDLLHRAGCPDTELWGALKALTAGQFDEAVTFKHVRAAGIVPRLPKDGSRDSLWYVKETGPGISDEEYEKAKARWMAEQGERGVGVWDGHGGDQRKIGNFDLSEVDTVEAPQWLQDLHNHPAPEPPPVMSEGARYLCDLSRAYSEGVIDRDGNILIKPPSVPPVIVSPNLMTIGEDGRLKAGPRGFAAAVETTTLAEMLRLTEEPE